jgi:hypothetical protein
MKCLGLLFVATMLISGPGVSGGEVTPVRKYFGHPGVEDQHGVIAPWYQGQNGQLDFRIRVAAETLKRYPWTDEKTAVMAAPHFVFNGHWGIQPDGTIRVNTRLSDWDNGDVGQRSVSLLHGLTNYYRYTGDAGVVGLITRTADYVLDYCQTPADHAWPGFFISCPTKGKAYGRADPHGFIQLDVAAQAGSALLAAYKLTGNARYREAVVHWADLLAEHCDRRPGARPWNRYANPEDAKWDTRQSAGVSLVLHLLDDVIRLGRTGNEDALVKARDSGERYLRDVLLPEWYRDPTFGHHFWDWLNPVATCAVPCYTSHYMMQRREAFPDWKTDVRNIVSLFFCRSSVDPGSAGDVYSGAWAFPEASNCCGKSLQYPSMATGAALARYGVLADSAWAREIARRQTILSTYDAHETGVVEDGIDGGAVVAGAWFNLAHPWPLRAAMEMLAWQPEWFGAGRENHIMRSTSVVSTVRYGKGRIAYQTFDAAAPCEDVLRLAFVPKAVTADGQPLKLAPELAQNGYTVRPLANGDCLVTIRHDSCRAVLVEGDDSQETVEDDGLQYEDAWSIAEAQEASGGKLRVASTAGARAKFTFTGNQVRLIGRAAPDGGRADVYLDGVKQLCGIDCWCPAPREQQVLCYKNGLTPGEHTLEIVGLGAKNPLAAGTNVWVDAVQWSAAQGAGGMGAGGGPAESQRVIFGCVRRQGRSQSGATAPGKDQREIAANRLTTDGGRKDVVDAAGNAWRPATEFIHRVHTLADLVPVAFWTEPQAKDVAGTPDPELYRYGVHGPDFTAYFTVAPTQTYHVRLKFCQAAEPPQPGGYATNVELQGEPVVADMDIAATAGGLGKAVDLVFNGVQPKHGVIAIRFRHRFAGDAMVQAIEVGPGDRPAGAKPVPFRFPPGMNYLGNPGFETSIPGATGTEKRNPVVIGRHWSYRFLGPNEGIVWHESAFTKHPQSGLPKPRSGKDAFRTHAMEKDVHTQVYQDVAARPATAYQASVWVQGVDVRGKGFGKGAADSAGLCVLELGRGEKVLVQHPQEAVTKAGEFTEVTKTFTTTDNTVKVRFLLDTVISCRWDEGHVTYDDAALAERAAP